MFLLVYQRSPMLWTSPVKMIKYLHAVFTGDKTTYYSQNAYACGGNFSLWLSRTFGEDIDRSQVWFIPEIDPQEASLPRDKKSRFLGHKELIDLADELGLT